MAVKIRLARIGKKKFPFYRVVAMDERSKRDGQALEILGTYNPRTKEFEAFYTDRVKHWLSVGAQMTDSAKKLCKVQLQVVAKPAAKKAAPKVEKPAVEVEEKASENKVAVKAEEAETEKKVAPKKAAVAKKEAIKEDVEAAEKVEKKADDKVKKAE